MFSTNQANKLESLPTAVSISDVAASDSPLIYVNSQFTELTGFEPEDCIGKNCRFLQGDATDRVSTKQISVAIRHGIPIEICIMNYRKDGTPFHNFLLLTPLPSNDERKLYLGCQYELKPEVYNVVDQIRRVNGIVRLISDVNEGPWGQTVSAIQMRAKSVKMLVDTYVANEIGMDRTS